MNFAHVLAVLFGFAITAALSTKVIYVNFAEDHQSFVNHQVKEGGMILVPPEKRKCKGSRTEDMHGNCRKLVQF